MKILITSVLSLSFATSLAFASGYGGYDQEPVEVSPVEMTITGHLKPTCEESKNSILDKIKFNGCEDKYEFADSCECVQVNGSDYCEYKSTISCMPYYEYFY